MSNRKERFTPGPWAINTGAEDDGVYVYIEEIESPHGMVAWARDIGDELVTTEPDAHLIAAAPELYEALECVLRVADRQTVEFDAARAALAKARGER